MSRTRLLLALLFAALTIPAAAGAEPMAFDGGHDIGAMMSEAARTWDLDQQDAVLLLEKAHFTWTDDGRLREEHHRVVWISTDWSIDHYADLRVPWDSDRQTLTVQVLRVWRENRWVEARETAVVETTPGAFRTAPDYTGIRETMLLHDGVELPCILECKYVVEDREPFRIGMQGQWFFRHHAPALNSWLVLEAGGGARLRTIASEGVSGSTEGSVTEYRMRNMEAEPLPRTGDPAAYLPRVAWSTFGGWGELGAVLRNALAPNLVLDDALRDSLAVVLDGAYDDLDRAERITRFVGRSQRVIRYDPNFFIYRVRPAHRTFDTGYGTAVDLAVLAGALFREAGLEARPVLVGPVGTSLDRDVATLVRFHEHGVLVSGRDLEAFYDPAGATLYPGAGRLYDRVSWVIGSDSPSTLFGSEGEVSRMDAAFNLRWNAEEESWAGTGSYRAEWSFSPFHRLAGDTDGLKSHLGRVAGGLLEGMKVESFGPTEFRGSVVGARMDVNAAAADRDAEGRLAAVIGSPAGGLMATLPGDVHLSDAERGSPVTLPGRLEQTVSVRLAAEDLEVVHLPDPVTITNPAGSFELAVTNDEGTVTVTRTVKLSRARYAAAEWPSLRELLLAEAHAANRTVLLK